MPCFPSSFVICLFLFRSHCALPVCLLQDISFPFWLPSTSIVQAGNIKGQVVSLEYKKVATEGDTSPNDLVNTPEDEFSLETSYLIILQSHEGVARKRRNSEQRVD
jgi:hypothetical protein